MKKILTLPHLHTSGEVAGLLQVDPEIIDRLIRCKRHPLWTWKPRWKEPRWDSAKIPEWRSILDTVDLDSLPADPPPLQRPTDVFRNRRRGPTAAELRIAAKMCGVRACDAR
jgi:hypothetical protein